MTSRWTHRTHHVTHSKDGWSLSIADEGVLGTIVERVTEGALAVLGHPCCGRGPLAKPRITWGRMERWGLPVPEDIARWDAWDEDAVEYFWYRVVNFPNRFHRSTERIRLPLTEAEAHAIAPNFVEGFGPEEDQE